MLIGVLRKIGKLKDRRKLFVGLLIRRNIVRILFKVSGRALSWLLIAALLIILTSPRRRSYFRSNFMSLYQSDQQIYRVTHHKPRAAGRTQLLTNLKNELGKDGRNGRHLHLRALRQINPKRKLHKSQRLNVTTLPDTIRQ